MTSACQGTSLLTPSKGFCGFRKHTDYICLNKEMCHRIQQNTSFTRFKAFGLQWSSTKVSGFTHTDNTLFFLRGLIKVRPSAENCGILIKLCGPFSFYINMISAMHHTRRYTSDSPYRLPTISAKLSYLNNTELIGSCKACRVRMIQSNNTWTLMGWFYPQKHRYKTHSLN